MKVVIQFTLGVLLFAIALLLTPTHCTDMIGDREVKVFQNPENFFTAFETCKYLGMDLLSIHNSVEEIQALNLAQKHNILQFWVAVTDLGHDFSFVSLITGKRLTYVNWTPSQPDNKGNGEHCLQLWQRPNNVRGWNNCDCSLTMAYLCEMPVRKLCCEIAQNSTCMV